MLKMFRNSAVFGAIATLFSISVANTPAQAQIETSFGTFAPSVTATSNYIFRGLSQTESKPALQGAIEYTYPVGSFTPYLGTFASNVSFPNNNTPAGTTDFSIRQKIEVDLFGGLRWTTPLSGLSLDVGFISYTYPGNTADQNRNGGPNSNGNPQWNEWYGKFAYDFGVATAVGSAFYARDFSYASGTGWYYEGGADVPMPFDFLMTLRLGRQTIERNASFGAPDYTTWNVGLTRDIQWPIALTLAGMYSDTNIKRDANLGLDNVGGTVLTMGRDSYNQSRNQFSFSIIKKF